ncbi:MAG: alpha/beta family hydrolase [Gemmatimonadota bacterium]
MDITIDTGTKAGPVSGLYDRPDNARALLVLAHGAGAGMRHPFMEMIATGLGRRQVATLRYQFPYMEAGRNGPDWPTTLEATVRAAVARGHELAPDLALFAGGKSLGGRMTSGAEAREHLADVRGIVFLGFPLHPPKKPSIARADHLASVSVPMLFIQGTRDDLADLELVRQVLMPLAGTATLEVVEGGDHSFKVLKRSGRHPEEVYGQILDTLAEFMERHSRG